MKQTTIAQKGTVRMVTEPAWDGSTDTHFSVYNGSQALEAVASVSPRTAYYVAYSSFRFHSKGVKG